MVVAVAIVAGAFVFWQLLGVAIIVFGAVVVAAVVLSIAGSLEHHLGIGGRSAYALAITLLIGTPLAAAWALGDPLLSQFVQLRQVLPEALDDVTGWLQQGPIRQSLLDGWSSAILWSRVAGIAGFAATALGAALLVIVAGLFLAADPRLYRSGVLRLLPPDSRPRVDAALLAAGHGLARWLVGQALLMIAVGAMVALGLWAIGMPLALSLGLIAGVLNFVPFIGPIVGGFLVVLVAFAQGPALALQAGLVVLAIQQLESFVLVPLVQRWTVRLPPVLALVSLLVFGVLFGVAGTLFAVPMMVVVMILVRELYVRELEQQTLVAG